MKANEIKHLDEITVEKYVSHITKSTMIQDTVEGYVLVTNYSAEYDSMEMKQRKEILLIELYTDIEFDDDVDDYDHLCQLGIINHILELSPDATEFMKDFDIVLHDYVEKYNSTVRLANMAISNIAGEAISLLSTINDKISEIDNKQAGSFLRTLSADLTEILKKMRING